MGSSTSKSPEEASDMFNTIQCYDLSDLKGVKYDYENLVFEGGGAKGIAYCGAIRALEEVGILQNIKRFAGASVGALSAMILAVGGSSVDGLAEGLADMQHLLEDSNRLALPINIMRNFGWHHGERMLKHLYDRVEQLSGQRFLTFEGLYKLRGVELCVVVTNLSCCSEEYFHPKTTPDMHIALAVRMSISIPVLFKPHILTNSVNNDRLVYVDGGICVNYPLDVYDGWFLSMKKEHSFFHMIDSKVPRFHKCNEKTLGMLVFDAHESETDEDVYLKRYREQMPSRPDTKLAKKNGIEVDKKMAKLELKFKMKDAASKFLQLLSESDLDRSGTISLKEFKQALVNVKKGAMSNEEWKLLFGTNVSDIDPEEIFRNMDTDQDKEISFNEFLAYMSNKGAPLREMVSGGTPHMDIKSVGGFLGSLLETNMLTIKKLMAKPDDINRSIGIYTDYIGTVDFQLTLEDKEFLVRHGWLAAVAFLREIAVKKKL